MKTMRWIPLLSAVVLIILLSSCGRSYVGVGTAPGPYYGPGFYGPRPYYGYRHAPYGFYRRPPVIVQRRTYVVPRNRFYNSPNARSYNGAPRSYGPRYNGNSGARGPR
ncbi:hypothetical protein [Spirosoma montaniterrae]|uniref:hypothetical protein n=1 Tax=Spirosoma montaniterrae TaxID=1178516 RepID=UPI0018DCF730|nr:hypothetical protein [Spirosoma montaniterrae]